MLEHQKAYQTLMGNSGSIKETEKQLEKQAAETAKNMDLSVVRLCFQAYLEDTTGNFTRALTPVISVPVYDCSKLRVHTNNYDLHRSGHFSEILATTYGSGQYAPVP